MISLEKWRTKMNLPNKITTFRAFLVPVFVFFMVFDKIPGNKWYALGVFIIASFSGR